jgi:hypothetical protein
MRLDYYNYRDYISKFATKDIFRIFIPHKFAYQEESVMTKKTGGNACQQCKKAPTTLPEPLAALREAVLDGRVAEVEELLANGQSVNANFGSGATPMHMAIQEGQVEVVKALLARGANLTSVTRADWTPGHMVALTNNVEIAELLLAAGMSLSATNIHGHTPLDLAKTHNKTEVLALFKKAGKKG